MDYGVLPTGFIKMRLPEIRAAIIADLKQRLLAAGLPADIQTRPDSVLGLLIDTFAEREAALWNVAEGVYTIREAGAQAAKLGIEMPITRILNELLDGSIDVNDVAERLMLREIRSE